jgi:hypothetical protein
LIARLTKMAHEAGKLIALDPKPRRHLAFNDLDLITPNKREALQLAGIEPSPHAPFPAAEVCARLYERHGTRNLVITMGEDGMLLSANGRVVKQIPTGGPRSIRRFGRRRHGTRPDSPSPSQRRHPSLTLRISPMPQPEWSSANSELPPLRPLSCAPTWPLEAASARTSSAA